MKLSISLSKDDFKYINFNESAGFQSVERAQDVFHASYLMEILQGDACLKTWKFAPAVILAELNIYL